MSDNYLSHFNLHSTPFTKEIDDAALWLPSSRQAIVEPLCEALEARHSVVLTGDPGVGKTSVLRAVRERIGRSSRFKLTYCHNATLGRRDFYRQLCVALGLRASATAAALFHAVSTHVEELGREHVHPVLLLDEAHLLHQDTLDHLHILLNYQWDSQALLSLVLVGLPELAERLGLRRNRSLYSRIHCRLHIEALTPADTAEYIEMRLHTAGANATLVSHDASALLHEASAGSMREIDRLMDGCLRLAWRLGHKLIDRTVVGGLLTGSSSAGGRL